MSASNQQPQQDTRKNQAQGEKRATTHVFGLRGQLPIIHGRQGRQFPVVDLVPPPADSASEGLSAERGVAVPEAPAGQRQGPEGALHEGEENLRGWIVSSGGLSLPITDGVMRFAVPDRGW